MSLEEAIDLLGELQVRGVRLRRAGERLRYRPRDEVSPDQLSRLAEHKEVLLDLVDLLGEDCVVELRPRPWSETIVFSVGEPA